MHKENTSPSAPTSSTTTDISNDFLVYESHGIRMKAPKNWERIGDLAFRRPLEKGESDYIGKFLENMNLVLDNRSSQAANLNEYTDYALKQIKADTLGSLNWKYDKTIESGSCTLGGLPAYKLIFTRNIGTPGADVPFMKVWAVKDNKAYIVTYAGLEKFYEYLPMVQKMVDSIEIK